MSGGSDRNDAALWRRWRDRSETAGEIAAEPDAMRLAAYAENRLDHGGADPEFDSEIRLIEGWLAEHHEVLDDVLEAKREDEDLSHLALTSILRRAQALVAEPQPNVVLLRSKHTLRRTVAWSSFAAGIIAASVVGFSVGIDDWLNLNGRSQSQAFEQELLGPSTPLLGGNEEDSAT